MTTRSRLATRTSETKRSAPESSLTIAPGLAWVTRPVQSEAMIQLSTSKVLDWNLDPAEDVSVYALRPLGGKGEEDEDRATEYKRMYTGLVLARTKTTPAVLRYAMPYPTWTTTHSLQTRGAEGTWASYIQLPAALPDVGAVDRTTFVYQEGAVQPEEEENEGRMEKKASRSLMAAGAGSSAPARGELAELAIVVPAERLQPGARVVVAEYPVALTYLTTFRVPRHIRTSDTPLPTKVKLVVAFPEGGATLFPGRLTVFRGSQTPTVALVVPQRADELKINLGLDPDVRVVVAEQVEEIKTMRRHTVTLTVTNVGEPRTLEVYYGLDDLHVERVEPSGRLRGTDLIYLVDLEQGMNEFTFTVTYRLPEQTRVVLQGEP